jgi:ubiquinone/menaquinone biosynthesis C-methylase UbiE
MFFFFFFFFFLLFIIFLILGKVGDAEKIKEPAGSFDVVFEKGTIDSILTGYHSHEKIKSVLSEISRVLTPTGTLISISHAAENYRLIHFKQLRYLWNVKKKEFPQYDGAPTDQLYYIYIMKKDPANKAAAEKAAAGENLD